MAACISVPPRHPAIQLHEVATFFGHFFSCARIARIFRHDASTDLPPSTPLPSFPLCLRARAESMSGAPATQWMIGAVVIRALGTGKAGLLQDPIAGTDTAVTSTLTDRPQANTTRIPYQRHCPNDRAC